ncbi:MAG TPA: alpha/beta fold hydrolase [Anaeromyxobacter sp.]|nr:alpha/beta fold hydrolase [Anaeromyxobacter sp.]
MIPLAPLLAGALAAAPARVDSAGFGPVSVHAPPGPPSRVVLLLSGAGGVDAAAAEAASALAARGALVVAIDTPAYLAARPAGRCVYPAGDLEELAQRIQKLRGVASYQRPVLVGHSRGAALAWAAVSNAPSGTFLGAVAAAPCPGRPLPVKLCAHGAPPRALEGGTLPPLAPPPAPVEVVAAAQDAICPAAAAAELARALAARLTTVQGAGHALSPPLVGAIADAVARLAPASPPPAPASAARAAAPAVPLGGLPVVEVPSTRPGRRIALLVTGDGGWVGADRALAAALADGGVSVVALDALRYFWQRRTPQETVRDAARILAHYRAAWGRDETVLVGYSRGADVVPILAALLPADERARLVLVAMLGPSTFAELEVHAVDLFASRRRAGAIPTEPAVRATAGAVRMLCFHGEDEKGSLCPKLADLPWVTVRLHAGGHRLGGGETSEMAREILSAMEAR